MNSSPGANIPDVPLPPVRQPTGWRYYLGTWSGRLIVLNFVVFVLMAYASQNILLPTPEVLLGFGAKDPVLLAQGQFWRIFTPIFVHIGIIHFAFNTMALYYVGYQLEAVLGPLWFMLTYLLAGVFGNVASSVFSVSVSAGASGALFGLLGSGFLLERVIGRRIAEMTGQRPRRTVYASMMIVNIIFGLLIPGIDNAAHLGGMIAGILLTMAMLYIRPNRLRQRRRWLGFAIIAAIIAMSAAGLHLAMRRDFIFNRFVAKAGQTDDPSEQVHYLTEALELEPTDASILFARGRLFLLHGESLRAYEDFRQAIVDPKQKKAFEKLMEELQSQGRETDAWELRRFLDHTKPI